MGIIVIVAPLLCGLNACILAIQQTLVDERRNERHIGKCLDRTGDCESASAVPTVTGVVLLTVFRPATHSSSTGHPDGSSTHLSCQHLVSAYYAPKITRGIGDVREYTPSPPSWRLRSSEEDGSIHKLVHNMLQTV